MPRLAPVTNATLPSSELIRPPAVVRSWGGLVSRASASDESRRRSVTANDHRQIGVGMLGYAFMGKAHANALNTIRRMTLPPPLDPRLVAIAGRNEQAVAEAA